MNAEAVVTNSFHGTAFSILFEKEFYVELNSKIGFNFRSDQLLKNVGIEGNEIVYDNPPEEPVNIDFVQVNEKLNNLREKSNNYLNKIYKSMEK